jgi:hypothetical protein
MKQFVLLACALSFVVACSSSSSGPKTAGENEKVANVTDYSVCENSQSPKSIEGSWKYLRTHKNANYETTIQIDPKEFSISNTCKTGEMELTASASAPSSYDSQYLLVLEKAEKASHIESEKGDKMDCAVSVPKIKFNYSFRGACLVLRPEGSAEDMVLVPAGL